MRTIADAGDAATLASRQKGNYDPARTCVVIGAYGSGHEFNTGINKSSAGYTRHDDSILHFDHPEEAWGYRATLVINNNDNSMTGVDLVGEQVEISYGLGAKDMNVSANDWIECAPMWVVAQHHASAPGINQIVFKLFDRIERTKYEKLKRKVTRFDWQRNTDGTDKEKQLLVYLKSVLCTTGAENQFYNWNNEAPADDWAEIELHDHLDLDKYVRWNYATDEIGPITPDWTYSLNQNNTRYEMLRTIMESTDIVGRMEASDSKYHTRKPAPYEYWDWVDGVWVEVEYDAIYEMGDGNHQWYYWMEFKNLVIPNKFHIKPANQSEVTATHSDYNILPFDAYYPVGDLQTTSEAHRLADRFKAIAEDGATGGFLVCQMDLLLEVHDRIKGVDYRTDSTRDGYVRKVHRITEPGEFRCEVTLGEMPLVVMHPTLNLLRLTSETQPNEIMQAIAAQDERINRIIRGEDEAEEMYLELNETVVAGDTLYICSDDETAGLVNATMDEAKEGYDIVLSLEGGGSGDIIRVLQEGITSYGPSGIRGVPVYLDRTDGDMTSDPSSDLVSGDALRKLGTIMNDGRMYFKPSTLAHEVA